MHFADVVPNSVFPKQLKGIQPKFTLNMSKDVVLVSAFWG